MKAINEKAELAQRDWDPPELIHWARRYIYYASKDNSPATKHTGPYNLERGYRYLAEGYEMNGNYDMALETYKILLELQQYKTPEFRSSFSKSFGGLHYQLGNREESFKMFCQYINECVVFYEECKPRSSETLQEFLNQSIRCIPIGTSKKFECSFETYQEFLNFMEEEYTRQEDQAPYQQAMEIYRNFAGDFLRERDDKSDQNK